MSLHKQKLRLVIITGASSGIGLATAKLFAKRGYPLVLLARRLEIMEALHLPHILCKAVDVTDRAGLIEAVKQAESLYGAADVIINNAGVMLLGDMTNQNPDEWDRMLEVNVKGLLNGIHAVAGSMVKRQHGTIIKAGYEDWKKNMGASVLSPEDVARAIFYAYEQPQGVCIREIVLASTRQQA
ncbi:SDR family oxidoreductase [Paenochrobactrum sp. BZR 588]|uniref:SDR family oxidoreductase n=1 Tax=unclassified Paenochrobactrum TaxID=2639760 RepID=UPI0038545939